MVSLDEAAALASLTGATIAVFIFLRKVIKTSKIFLKDQEEVRKSIETIKGEVTLNDGSSMKDAIHCLRDTCQRIEITQQVLDQRSKAALHYTERPLFETDQVGRVAWSNESFQKLTNENGDFSKGLDWISIINEEERAEFLKEFNSCLEMCRRIDIETESVDGNKIHFLGYPYRISEKSHKGFLIHLHRENN